MPCMVVPVYFDDKITLQRNEISNKISYDMLTKKLYSKCPVTDMLP